MTSVVASHGGSSSPASTTGAVYAPLTLRAAATSCRNRWMNAWSRASSGYTTFTAIGRPAGEKPRYTRPMPPAPSLATSLYRPIRRGSSALRGSISVPTPGADRWPGRYRWPNRLHDCPY